MNDIKVDPFKDNDILQGKINPYGLKVENKVDFKGRKYVPWDPKASAHSKFHQLIANLFTSITALFENYDVLLVGEDKKNENLMEIVSGTELKKDIDHCVSNLNSVSKALRLKEKELIKYTELLKKDANAEHFDEHYPVVSDLRNEIRGLKESWNESKKRITRLQRKLRGTAFENSTALIRLERAEHKLNQTLEHVTKATQKYTEIWKGFDRKAEDTEEARAAYGEAVDNAREHGWEAFDTLADQLTTRDFTKIRAQLQLVEGNLKSLRDLAAKNSEWNAAGSKSEGMTERGIKLKLEMALPIIRLFVDWRESYEGQHIEILQGKKRLDQFLFVTADLSNNVADSKSTDEEIRKPMDVIKHKLNAEIQAMLKVLDDCNLPSDEKTKYQTILHRLLVSQSR